MFAGDGWEYLDDAVEQAVAEQDDSHYGRYTGHGDRITVRIPAGARPLLKAAAHARGMGMQAFATRAIMSWVVHDLGADWFEVMIDEYPITRYGRSQHDRERYGGAGFGNWQVGQP